MRLPILATIALCACSSIVPSTALRLSGLSPTTADPADFAIDLALPAGIDIQPGTAQLIFGVSRSDTGQEQSGNFVLERAGSVFLVAASDVDRLRALQATARQWGAENDAATEGVLGVILSPCRIGDGPDPKARVSVGLRLAQDGAFLPLVRNGPLSAVASEDEIRQMPLCP
ncbi:hypothetical protein [Roseobacter sp. CCS2]|uniref:hypothetical protein n=1 Tax=Roseobacter sp. CCS2 TaxID=391593 RepID=UPI0000F400E6|nr:hypothetical protein [Roseobacter sp. CCS2]EBA13579.1 hypothetical protein RCCS2_06819 [Roseobacter sp. CCS2]